MSIVICPHYRHLDRPCHICEFEAQIVSLKKKLLESQSREMRLREAAEMLWVVLANVSEGDWKKQSAVWQDAAERYRDNYFKTLKEGAPPIAEVLEKCEKSIQDFLSYQPLLKKYEVKPHWVVQGEEALAALKSLRGKG